MSIKYDRVTLRLSELQTTTVIVAPWETPLLQAMYGDEAEVTGSELLDRPAPSANDEFARLADRYGPKNSDTPVVAAVYGKFGPGVAKLNVEINRACDIAVNGETPTAHFAPEGLTDEQIDAVVAQGNEAQMKIIPTIEPKPPIASNNPAFADNADDLV